MNALSRTLERAIENLNASGNRSAYARDVLRGRAAWSGADLKGKAKQFSSGYYSQRIKAKHALFAAGGTLLHVERNRLVAAVRIGVDDYGNSVYTTEDGTAVQRTAAQARHL